MYKLSRVALKMHTVKTFTKSPKYPINHVLTSPILGLDEKPAMAARPKLMHGPVRSVKKRTPAPASSECCTPRAVNGVGRVNLCVLKIFEG